jgi:hypothetical protein
LEKTCIKECVDNCRLWLVFDYPKYLFHIYSMISRFDAHCDFNILFLLLTLSVPVIMAVFFGNFVIKFCSWNIHLCMS